VIGVDCAWNVLGDTAAEIDAAALRHAEAPTIDARQLPLADRTFDWVLCSFALSEFSQPARALHEFMRVLRPGGSIAVSAWSEDCPFLSWWQEVVRPHADASNLSDWATGRLQTPARLDCALRDAGFENIRTTFHDGDFVYADEEEWWTSLDSIGSCLRLKHLPASALTRLKTEMIDKIAFLKQSDGIHNPYRALLTLGAKSA
jgi:SAM-dependent methyltransferase